MSSISKSLRKRKCKPDTNSISKQYKGSIDDGYHSQNNDITMAFDDDDDSLDIAQRFIDIENRMCDKLDSYRFSPPVTHVYNPLRYARESHQCYIEKYCRSRKPLMFLGMNPGPYGMAQNGVPFGCVSHVREWLGISGHIERPEHEHPARPVLGWQCHRKEVSGDRFWGLWKELCGTPQAFFAHAIVHNYCPLVFMSHTGKNVTPPQLPAADRHVIESVCDDALREVVALLRCEVVVGVGKFAETSALRALRALGTGAPRVCGVMHPSPVNPMANKGWADMVRAHMCRLNLHTYLPVVADPSTAS